MSWEAPGRAVVVVIHELDGVVHHYTRDEDDAGEGIWRGSDASITTAELLDALTRSLQAPYVAPE
jgi:hypothetical protein